MARWMAVVTTRAMREMPGGSGVRSRKAKGKIEMVIDVGVRSVEVER